MAVPAGMVNRGGEYFLKEQQVTNPKLALDNRASGPVNSSPSGERRRPSGSSASNSGYVPIAPAGEVAVEPTNRAPQPAQGGGSNKGGNNSHLDSLF